ncbi:hypothetical protein GF376_01040 [Candidatus Peregrinibacteria bacterium]|nr:hypothetical protein [Candidatus Peregrinibacteria bacterium]
MNQSMKPIPFEDGSGIKEKQTQITQIQGRARTDAERELLQVANNLKQFAVSTKPVRAQTALEIFKNAQKAINKVALERSIVSKPELKIDQIMQRFKDRQDSASRLEYLVKTADRLIEFANNRLERSLQQIESLRHQTRDAILDIRNERNN